MIEHGREHAWCIHARGRPQLFDRFADPDCSVVDIRRLAGRLWPQQGDRLGHVADIVTAHVEENRIDALFGDGAYRRAFDRRDIERAGQRGEAIAAVRVRRLPEIIADQLEFGVARARVDELVEQLRKGAHGASNA